MLKKLFRRRALIEELEPRILFSADLAPFALDGLSPAPEQRVLTADGEYANLAATTRNELVIVDTGVQDYQTLLDDILDQAGEDRHFDIVLLDADRDGIQQISDALKQYGNLDALHLISHGDPGSLQLGSSRLDAASLDTHAADISAWGTAFNADADLLLYGCDVASGATGADFVSTLSHLTGTDVAASTDKTGSAAQGGNWILENQVGAVETSLILGPVHTVWQGVLDITAAPGQTLANTTTANDQLTTPSSRQVAMSTDGSFVVVWTSGGGQDGSNYGIFLRQFNADGTPRTGEIRVNTFTAGHQQNPAIAMDDSGNFVVVWESQNQDGSGYGIYAQRFNTDASTATTGVTGEFRINSATSGDQTSPSVAMDNSGNFVVAWTGQDSNGQGVFARRFDANGNPISEFAVNSTPSNNQFDPAVAMNKATGDFVIVWTSEDQDGSGDGVYGRLFNAAGSTVKSEFRVHATHTFGNQYAADVAMNDSGKFVVAFTDDILGNPNIDAFAFDATGTSQGFVFFPNQYSSGVQQNPSVAIDNSGDFVVVWESQDQDGDNYGIVARHFKANNSAYENEKIINVETAASQNAPSIAWRGSQAVFLWGGNSAADSRGASFRLATITSGSNTQPSITSDGGLDTAAISIAENTTTVTTVTASDAETPGALTFSIVGGPDQTIFNLNPGTGVLTFASAPDYENPQDAGGDNVYNVMVQVSDGTLTDTQAIAVTVTNVNDASVLITAAQDTYILNGSTNNYGTSTSMIVDRSGASALGDGRALLQFDLSTIPAGATIISASLQMQAAANGGAFNIDVHKLTQAWVEGSGGASEAANWDQRLPGTNWTDTGGTFDPVRVARLNTAATGQHSWDLTSLAQAWYTGSTVNYGIIIGSPDSGTTTITYDSSEGTTPPRLAITYTTPSNIAPVLGSASLVLSEGQTVTLSAANFGITDPDDSVFTYTVSAVSGGYFQLSSATGTPITSFTSADLTANLVQFVDDGNETAPGFSVTVNDGDVDSNTLAATVNYTPVNDAPVALDDSAVTDEDTPVTINVVANDTDAEGSALTVSAVTQGANGTVSFAGGSVTYTPNAHFNGSDSFTYTAFDGGLYSNTVAVTITVNPVNDAPVLSAATLTLGEGQTVTLSAANFGITDPDDSVFTYTVSAVSGGYFQLSSSAGTPITSFTSADLTANLVQFVDDGNETAPGFSVTVSDGDVDSNTLAATVSYTPVNDAPVALDDSAVTDEDTPVTINVVANDTDAEGSVLTVSAVTQGANGTVSFAGGSVTYTPNAHFNGSDSFTYTATDGALTSGVVTVSLTVTPINDAPTASGSAFLAAIQEDDAAAPGATVADLFAANFSNPEDAGAPSHNQFAGIAVRGQSVNPAQGRWQYSTDNGASWNNFGVLSDATAVSLGLSDKLRFLPAADYAGTPNTLSVRLLDNSLTVVSGGPIDVSVNGGITAISSGLVPLSTAVTPVNDAPVASDTSINLAEDAVYSGTLPPAADAEGDTLSYTLVSQATNGTVAVNADGSFTYTPAANFHGSDSFTYTAHDGLLGSNVATVSITVSPVNDAPAFSSSASFSAPEHSPAGTTVTATDIEGNTLTYAISGGADAALFSIDAATGALILLSVPNYAAPLDANRDNIYEVTITVSDGQGGSANLGMFLVVTDVIEPVAPTPPAPPAPPPADVEPEPPEETPEPVAPVTASPALPPAAVNALDPAIETFAALAPQDAGFAPEATRTAPQFNDLVRKGEAIAIPLLELMQQTLKGLASDVRALEMLQVSLSNTGFQQQLDQLHDDIRHQLALDKNMVASTLAVSTGLSVGYVLWLVRGGVLLSSLLTSLPAWRLIDPLPILGHLGRHKDDAHDDDSLENMLKKSNAQPTPPAPDETTP